MKVTVYTLISLLLFVYIPHAQILPYEKYTSKNGLIADRITAISQDSQGFMWFGSYFGICRYDGNRFETIQLPPSQQNKYVTFIGNANGKVYAGFLFRGGLAEYYKERVRSYFIPGQDSMDANEFVCMADNGDGSILLCNTSSRLYQFRDGKFTYLCRLPLKPGTYPRSMLRDPQGRIWLSTESGLFITSYPYRNMQSLHAGLYVFSLSIDSSGTISLGSFDGKKVYLHRYHTVKKNYYQAAPPLLLPAATLIPFSGNTKNGFWMITADSNLVSISKDGQQQKFRIPLDYTTDIPQLFADRENNIWIANEPGITRISRFGSKAFAFQELAAGGGDLVMLHDSILLATNSKYLYSISGDRLEKKKETCTNTQYFGNFLEDKNGNVWISQWNEAVWKTRWKNGIMVSCKGFRYYHGKTIAVSTMVEDSRGTIWMGGIHGLFRIRDDKVIGHYQPLNVAGHPSFISSMVLDEKNKTLWLGDNAQGISVVHYTESGDSLYLKPAGFITTSNGLADMYVRSLQMDPQGKLWIGTRYGGIFLLPRMQPQGRVTHMNAAAGLQCTRIADIEIQDSTAVWFATCKGVFRYDQQKQQWRQFHTNDGLMNAEIYALAIDKKSKSIWALTAQGITKIDPSFAAEKVPPLITITGVTVLGQRDSTADFSSLNRYAHSRNSIGFVFTGTSFSDEKNVRYRYILEGYDKHWSQPVASNVINYVSLPPGQYTFRVQAANAQNIWSTQDASFQFQIVRPFYKSPWFYFACILLLLSLIYFIRMQRLRQHVRIEQLRLSIAKDLHDDVGSTLGSINLLSQTASRRLVHKPGEEVMPIFEKISHSAEHTLEAMDDIVWSINPEKDKGQDLLIRMREFAIPLLEARNISFDFRVQMPEQMKLPMNLRRNIFLVFKEAVYNVIRHADATHTGISIQSDGHTIEMRISDNGKGFEASTRRSGNGLKNMKLRAEATGGRLAITSSAHGTALEFSAPVKMNI